MKYKYLIQEYAFQRHLELFAVILVLGILSVFATETFCNYEKTAWTTQIFGSEYMDHRNQSVLYFAHHGKWPDNNTDAENFSYSIGCGIKKQSTDNYNIVKKITLDQGSIHITLGNENIGHNKTITLRPAVPAQDSFSTVIWIFGNKRKPADWQIFGKDKTDIDDKYISKFAM